MMARVKGDPTNELDVLHGRRMEVALARHAAEAAMNHALQLVEGSDERRRQVLLAEARGEDAGMTVEQIDRERQVAELTARDQKQRMEVSKTVEGEIEQAREAVIDAHGEYFRAAAVASSEATAEALSVARDAAQAASTAWMDCRAAWMTVRQSRRRRGLDLGYEPPVHDLGTAVHELSTQISRPWPGGSRENYERWASRPEASEGAA